jgi:myo-inositol-1(or 4)-monophosphatase
LQDRDIELLKNAALQAGEIALKHFRKDPKKWDKSEGQGPVTEADIEVNQMLLDVLRAERPDYGWLSEESEDSGERLSMDRVFIIDPIDGTRSFIAGHENYAHSLAIADKGKIVAAVVHLPSAEKTYTASLGGGAFLNGRKIAASSRTELGGAKMLTSKPQMDPKHWPGGVPNIDAHFRSSLAYRMCLVAEGCFDAMVTFRDCWEWDIAAGDLIAREAGAVVSDRTSNRLVFNNSTPTQEGVVVAPAIMHQQIIAKSNG